MTALRLILGSIWHYRRPHTGVLLGAAVGTAVLVGALIIGDSVRGTLGNMAAARVGRSRAAMLTGDRFVSDTALNAFDDQMAAAILLPGVVTTPDGRARVNHVQVLGIDDAFWRLSPSGGAPPASARFELNKTQQAVAALPWDENATGVAGVNRRLAQQLKLNPGDTIVIRFDKPTAAPRDMPLATDDDSIAALRMTIDRIADDAHFGRFSLSPSQIEPPCVYIPRKAMALHVDQPRRANLFLTQSAEADTINRSLQNVLTLSDLQYECLPRTPGVAELRTPRVFIDQPVYDAVLASYPQARRILTYFVNRLRHGESATPYSTVAAVDHPATDGLAEHGMLINQWLADDQRLTIGDEVTLDYYVVAGGRRLVEKSAAFRVAGILPMDHPALGPDLMPDYPGIADAEHCRDWEAGFPLDYEAIRDKDEAYWQAHRGTPKALIRFDAGQRLWSNRFGVATALRISARAPDAATRIMQSLKPADLGLRFTELSVSAQRAADQSMDFGGLFLAMSFFLIIAAAVLTGMLFIFGIEQRAKQVGLMLSIGLEPKHVARLLLFEGAFFAVAGSLMGAAMGVGYGWLILAALRTFWRDAVGTGAMQFHAGAGSIIGGAIGGIVIATLAMALTLRRLLRQPPQSLLAGRIAAAKASESGRRSLAVGLVFAIGAAATAACARGHMGVAAFFGAGSLLLAGSLLTLRGLLMGMHGSIGSIAQLGASQMSRRRSRSLAAATLIACGTFMVVAVGMNRHDPASGVESRQSGAGGFALYAEATLPILDREVIERLHCVPLRMTDGDDASCLNLNRAQQPRLLGVAPAALAGRFDVDWSLLEKNKGDVVSAIGDEATVRWGLHRSVGDEIDYVDEAGRRFQVRIAAIMSNSILQGSLIVDQSVIECRFPSVAGHRILLVDSPQQQAEVLSAKLTRDLADRGIEVISAGQRLALFSAAERTYLSIFQALGGLGMILGSGGLGMIVLRNLLERRGELALLSVVGFSRRDLHRLVISEHAALLLAGLIIGVVSAIIAVWPAVQHNRHDLPWLTTAMTVAAIGLCGMLSVWIATRAALRGPLLNCLRSE